MEFTAKARELGLWIEVNLYQFFPLLCGRNVSRSLPAFITFNGKSMIMFAEYVRL